MFSISFSQTDNEKQQKQGNIWYFGENAGLDFNSGMPVVLTDGALSTTEGCATISDAQGKLLFYTDGISVWNKNHQKMPNGTELHGDPSSTQSGVIIPDPGNENMYYVFTIDDSGTGDGFKYSKVDMTKENGLGDITKKNISILDTVAEKITAVRHRNNKDIWIITHKFNSNEFYAYLLTASGFIDEPVITAIGSMHQENSGNSIGYMKSSPDGTNLAVAVRYEYICELFDFDNQTGKFSNHIKIQLDAKTYGVEFSPDNSLLYITYGNLETIIQYNLQAGSADEILNSAYHIKTSEECGMLAALQLGPDGKIYVSKYNCEYLGVIKYPNKIGADCEYVENYIYLEGNKSTLGLPTFYQSYFDKTDFKEDEITYFDENVEITAGKTIVLNNILFDYNKSSLKSESYIELNKVVEILKNNLNYKISILGHTDNVGNKSNNIKLSEARAKSVKKYFISKGISDTRISFIGYGSSKPIVSNATKEGRQKNRRVEFIINK